VEQAFMPAVKHKKYSALATAVRKFVGYINPKIALDSFKTERPRINAKNANHLSCLIRVSC
jgi:hypothetical protein